MKRYALSYIISVFTAASLLILNGCKDPGINDPYGANDPSARTFMKIAQNSTSVNSFTPNYNEEEAMALSNSLGKDFYPIKIGQKLTKTDESMTLEKDSTTATGTLVQKFEGKLIIAGTFQKETIGVRSHVDTVIEKPFSTTITRLIKYERVANTGNDTTDWKIVAVSLPAGGTDEGGIAIQKLTLTSEDGSEIVIDDPNTYFFDVGNDKDNDSDNDEEHDLSIMFSSGDGYGHAWHKLFTWYKKHQAVKLTVEVLSASGDPDLLTLTYGATMNSHSRSKQKFDLVSTVPSGDVFVKTYETNWYTSSYNGRKHAVINALTRYSAYDSDSTVVEKTWGIPYRVK